MYLFVLYLLVSFYHKKYQVVEGYKMIKIQARFTTELKFKKINFTLLSSPKSRRFLLRLKSVESRLLFKSETRQLSYYNQLQIHLILATQPRLSIIARQTLSSTQVRHLEKPNK